jgi:2-polyprenyl-3-methyl-5-hydroxy-6-metoxy-1,4-benzoquinol methylase
MAITPPLRVLDLGCGDGTTAIPLARAGVEVVGIDIARNLIEAGNKRAAEAVSAGWRFKKEMPAIWKASQTTRLI